MPIAASVRATAAKPLSSRIASCVTAVERDMSGEATVDRLDGLTVDFGEAWLNLRPSNTEPFLRLNVEARTRPEIEQLIARVETSVEAVA